MAKSVLIVEDEQSVREFEKFVLEEEGYEVIEARDGLEGLAKAEFKRPDLILLDLMMPDLSGSRIFREMRTHPTTAGIPIIVITGKHDAHEMLDDEVAPEDVVMKPFEAETFLAAIHDRIGDAD